MAEPVSFLFSGFILLMHLLFVVVTVSASVIILNIVLNELKSNKDIARIANAMRNKRNYKRRLREGR